MTISDEAFRNLFKPIQVPAHYTDADTDDSKVIFALAQIGHGTVEQVVDELKKLDTSIDKESYLMIAEAVLNGFFEKGLLGGEEENGRIRYDLNKITHANDGAVNPDLLAPGLD